MGSKTMVKIWCDIKDCPIIENIKQKQSLQVIFVTEQTEGQSCNPYLRTETFDICSNCYKKVLNGKSIFARGAQGYNTFYFKD